MIPDPQNTDLILASASPRRAALLEQLGIRFVVLPAHVDESSIGGETAADYVKRVARSKAETVNAAEGQILPVLGADTTVVVGDQILGKPANIDDARFMLSRLSGTWHEVHTGVALAQQTCVVIEVTTRVKFRPLGACEIDAYWASGEPADKAGAYAVQGLGGAFVERIEGSPSNVVGLPLVETLKLLENHGIAHRLRPAAR